MKLMKMLAALFGVAEVSQEQAVIVHFNYGSSDLQRLIDVKRQIELALSMTGAGDLHGTEITVDGSHGSLYLYGPDADRLFEVVRPALESASFMQGAKARKRYGSARKGRKERIVTIGRR